MSSGIVTAQLFPWHFVLLIPSWTVHMPAASQVCTQILLQYSSLQGERRKNLCRREESDNRKDTEDVRDLGMLGFYGKSEIQLHWK